MGVAGPSPTEAEIAVLEALAAQAEKLAAATAPRSPAYVAPLLFVDPDRQFLVLGRSGVAAADSALLGQRRAELSVEWGEWRIAFGADAPEPCTHDGTPAIRVRFPQAVSINRRRMHDRAIVPENSALRCVSYSRAAVVFDAIITDVSYGGVGILLDAESTAFEPGMRLPRCRIEGEGRRPAVVDLEVRHLSVVTLADGRRVTRAGCRFENLSPEAMKLVAEISGD